MVTVHYWSHSMRTTRLETSIIRVGKENHALGNPCRFGVWTREGYSWVNAREWKLALGYMKETLVTNGRAFHERLGLQLTCNDVVDFRKIFTCAR